MGKIPGLTESEKQKILELAEKYVAAKTGDPGAYVWFELVAYLKGLRKERLKIEQQNEDR